jgi:hypothetical protein
VTTSVVVAIVGVALANTIAFGAVLLQLGRLSERLELVWQWYLIELGPRAHQDRRRDVEPRDDAGSGRPRRRVSDTDPLEDSGRA